MIFLALFIITVPVYAHLSFACRLQEIAGYAPKHLLLWLFRQLICHAASNQANLW
jgi:uncharacterized membrane protein (DUF106 family)